MNPKVMLFLFFGVGIVGVVMFLHVSKPAMLKPAPPKKVYVHVYVAKHDLQRGHRLNLNDLTERTFVLGKQPFGSLLTTQGVIGDVVRFPITAGKVIFGGDLISQSEPGFLQYTIPPGKGAISIILTKGNAVNSFVQPGDRVNVLWHVNRQPTAVAPGYNYSQVVLHNVLVLSVDHSLGNTSFVGRTLGRMSNSLDSAQERVQEQVAAQRAAAPMALFNPNAPLVVTLEVTPEEAATLTQAMNAGVLSLMLQSAYSGDDTEQSSAISGTVLIYNGPGGQ